MNTLGRTGLQVFPIGFGGIVVMDAEPERAGRVVATAVENGINYFDVAPSYGDAEIKLGPALKPFRKDVYLACKTHLRDAKGARENLNQSLKNLQTDYFDVYQLHALTDVEKDVHAAFAKGGAMEVALEAKKAGVIGNIGFSAHSPEAALAAMAQYDFDTVMCPVNFCLHFQQNFEVEIIEAAQKRQMGIIALKTLAKQKWQDEQSKDKYKKCWYEPIDDVETAKAALNWTLNRGVSIAISPGEESLLRLMMQIAPDCQKPTTAEVEKLRSLAGKCEAIL